MKSWCIAIIMGAIVLAALVSGCSGQSGLTMPAGFFKPDQISWYQYSLTEEQVGANQTPVIENKKVRVESFADMYEGVPAEHKIISVIPEYAPNKSSFYDVYVDKDGRVLAGNYTSEYEDELQSIPSGNDYAKAVGRRDISARLDAEKNKPVVILGYEMITYHKEPYNFTVYSLFADETTFKVWYNASLPAPVRIVANLTGSNGSEVQTFEQLNWGYSGSSKVTTPTFVLPTHESDPSNTTVAWPGPSRLFDMDGISWYQYDVQQQTKDTVEYQKHIVEYSNETYYTGVPVKHTSISRLWLHKDLVSSSDIWDNSSDGSAVDSRFGGRYNGTPYSLAPGAGGAAGLRMYDVSTRFDAGRDSTLKAIGFEPVSYGDQIYNCTVYVMPGENATYKVWHNQSLPLPLRISIDSRYPNDFPDGLWRYELEGWGYSPDTYNYLSASQEGENEEAIQPGPSMLFDLRNVSRYQYIVALQMNGENKSMKLDTSYEYPEDKRSKDTWVKKSWLYEENNNGFRIEENRDNGTILSGNTTGGVTQGQPYAGRDLYAVLLEDYRKDDVSTRFNADTDSTMKLAGYETISYKGDQYNCTVYDVTAGDDSFRVWKNASLPLPLKIMATYEKPAAYFWHPSFGIVSGPCTYELVDWS